MRGAEQDGESVTVELVDADEPGHLAGPAVPPALGEAPDGAPAPDPRERRRRWALGGVGGAVVLGLVATSVVVTLQDARRAAEREEALAAVGIRLADLSGPLEEVWRASGHVAAVAGDLVVLNVPGLPGVLRAVDPVDGRVVWEVVQDGSEWCEVWNPAWAEIVDAAQRGEVVDVSHVPDATDLVCGNNGSGDTSGVDPGEVGGVRVVDLATGVDVWARQMPGRIVGANPAADGLVVTRAQPDGALVVTGLAVADGAERWEHRVAVPDDLDVSWAWAYVFGGVVHVRGPDGSVLVALDAATGEEAEPIDEADMLTGAGAVTLADGARVEVAYTPAGPTGTVRGPDGEERFTFRGNLWVPTVVEPSAADPLLVVVPGAVSELAALDPRSGQELWRTELRTAVGGAEGLRFGDVVVGGVPTMAAFHLLSGQRLWQVETDDEASVGLVTDGTRLLVALREDGGRYLAAIRLRDGGEAWRVPVDGPPWSGQVAGDGTVVLQRDALVVGYR